MPSLKEMTGQTIHAFIPHFDPKKIRPYKLHNVETSGLWLESQEATDTILEYAGVQTAPKTLVLFVPFHRIELIFGSTDVPSLSEKGLGI